MKQPHHWLLAVLFGLALGVTTNQAQIIQRPPGPGGQSLENRANFERGIAFARAAYYAGAAASQPGARRLAIEELAMLADELEPSPGLTLLRQATRMTLRNEGTDAERRQQVENAASALADSLPAAGSWYFRAGGLAARSLLSSYFGEGSRLRTDLAQARGLLCSAPCDAPASLCQPLQELAKYGQQTTFTVKELVAIERAARSALQSLGDGNQRFAE